MYRTVPNQKIVKIQKDRCDNSNRIYYYSKTNLDSESNAAKDLDAGAFKLWRFFSRNTNGYEFALSNKDAEENFGIKIKQYNNAVETLISKGYLVKQEGNNYIFYETPVNFSELKKENVLLETFNNIEEKKVVNDNKFNF